MRDDQIEISGCDSDSYDWRVCGMERDTVVQQNEIFTFVRLEIFASEETKKNG